MANLVALLPLCPKCGRPGIFPRRRMNTAYVEDEKNYCRVCLECFIEIQEEWDYMWKEYYAGLL